MTHGIGIDLGATRMKIAAVSEDRTTIDTRVLQTGKNPAQWIKNINSGIKDSSQTFGSLPAWIGIAAPGLASRDCSQIEHMPGRLEGLEGLKWEQELIPSAPACVLNDAQAALYGEKCFGSAKNSNNVVLITLGTGVGGAAVVDGHLLRGNIGRAGHLGHMSIDAHGPPDICCTPGSIEYAIGEISIAERTDGYVTTTSQLVDLYNQGDKQAEKYWLASVQALACAIAGIINILDPEMIIIGGGIAESAESLFTPLNKYLDMYEWRPKGQAVKILPAELKDTAGAIGACCFAQDHTRHNRRV